MGDEKMKDITPSTSKYLYVIHYVLSTPRLMGTSHKRYIQAAKRAFRSTGIEYRNNYSN